MAFTFSATNTGSGTNFTSEAAATPYNYRDVFGFDNAPDSTNLPQIYEREVTIYGNRSLSGFLRMIGSEMPTNSQQVRWAEQKRLHIIYNRVRRQTASTGVFNIYANDVDVTTPGTALVDHSVRVGDKVLLGSGTAAAQLGYVSAKDATNGRITVQAYGATTDAFTGLANTTNNVAGSFLTILVIGTEFGKGSDSRAEVIQPEYTSYTNSTVIQRDTYAVNGTDANQVGWVEIADENGVQGKYWYVKGKSETMSRWEDYQETALLEDRVKSPRTTAQNVGKGAAGSELLGTQGGSEGLFAAIESRGYTTTGGFATGATGSGFRDDLDAIVERLDQEGNIEENVFFLDREESLNFDDGMSNQNNEYSGGSAWGMFNNSESMGLSLGFRSVRRGSYDFYKKDWKYLNQRDGRGSFNGIKGVSIPMGTKSVYDQYGANLSMPFASIHYLAGPHHSRKNQSWVHGGQAPTPTSGLDSMNIEFLSEKCIAVKGANNFILFQ